VRDAEKDVIAVASQYQAGAITAGQRYNKIIEIWSKVPSAFQMRCIPQWIRTRAPAII